MNKRTAVYIRVSTSNQRTDSQEQELSAYCRQRGWENPAFYTDRVSGATTTRPELDRLLQDMRSGKVERVVVFKLDRLGRSLTHLAHVIDEMSRLRVPLVASSQGIDTSEANPAGRLQLNVLLAVAEFERGIIKERVNAGLAAARKRGVRLGRPPMDREQAAKVKELRGSGMTFRAIAEQLGMKLASVHKAWSTA